MVVVEDELGGEVPGDGVGVTVTAARRGRRGGATGHEHGVVVVARGRGSARRDGSGARAGRSSGSGEALQGARHRGGSAVARLRCEDGVARSWLGRSGFVVAGDVACSSALRRLGVGAVNAGRAEVVGVSVLGCPWRWRAAPASRMARLWASSSAR